MSLKTVAVLSRVGFPAPNTLVVESSKCDHNHNEENDDLFDFLFEEVDYFPVDSSEFIGNDGMDGLVEGLSEKSFVPIHDDVYLAHGDDESLSCSVATVTTQGSVVSSVSNSSLESFDTDCDARESESVCTYSSNSSYSAFSPFSGDASGRKETYRKMAVKRWLEKRTRRIAHQSKKRPYVARSAIALRRARTTGGRFVKSTCKFVPANDLD